MRDRALVIQVRKDGRIHRCERWSQKELVEQLRHDLHIFMLGFIQASDDHRKLCECILGMYRTRDEPKINGPALRYSDPFLHFPQLKHIIIYFLYIE